MLFETHPEVVRAGLYLEWPDDVERPGPDLYKSAREEYSLLAKNQENWTGLMALEEYLTRQITQADDAVSRLDGSAPDLEERIFDVRIHCLVRLRVVRSVLRSRICLGRDLQSQLEEWERKYQRAMREMEVQNELIKQMTRARRDTPEISREDLVDLMDQSRFKSTGVVNFAKLGRALGVHGDTARSRVRKAGLMGYATSPK